MTEHDTATLLETTYPWADQPHAAMRAALGQDPDIGHIASVELARTSDPVRWRIDQHGVTLRGHAPLDVPTPWNTALTSGHHRTLELHEGATVTLAVVAVPEKAHATTGDRGSRQGRGNRRPILDPDDINTWLEQRLATSGTTAQILTVTPTTIHSARRNRTWRAVHATATATIQEPTVLATWHLGRHRSYGFGAPAITT